MQWQPSQKTRLTLKQLGFSQDNVRNRLKRYSNVSVEPNDRDFLRLFIGSPVLDNSHYRLLHQAAQLPLFWQPERDLCKSLHRAGYTADAISHYRDLFVIRVREEGRVVANPDTEFRRYCQSRPKRIVSPIHDDWQPDRDTLHRLVQHNISIAFSLSLVPEFILYWKDVGRIESNWQPVFLKRVLAYAVAQKNYGEESAQIDNELLERTGSSESTSGSHVA